MRIVEVARLLINFNILSNSSLTETLEVSQYIKFRVYDNEEKLRQSLSNEDIPVLGIVLPPKFSYMSNSESQPPLEGYYLYWVKEEDALRLKRLAEREISQIAGKDVSIDIQENRLYPQGTENTLGVWAGLSLLFISVMLG